MTDVQTQAPAEVRSRLALALDVDDMVVAIRAARELRPWFGVAKVGLELFSSAGPDAVGALAELGYEVFCDLKLHDIPTTVNKAAHVLGVIGVNYLTIHAAGGVNVLRAGAEGLAEGAAGAGLPAPIALGVTILTSDGDAPEHILHKRVAAVIEAGCGGLVCAASQAHEARQLAPRLRIVVPGIRPAGAPTHDQARPATPAEAIEAGADLLVIGRAVLAAPDRRAAAAAVVAEISEALGIAAAKA